MWATRRWLRRAGCDGGGGAAAGCDPSKGAVGDSCGVFVSSSKGDDLGDGSRASPYRTIGKAIGSAKAVYLCGESFSEVVTLPSGQSIYGALDCSSDWHYDSKAKSTITATDPIVFKVSGSSGATTVQDVALVAQDATMAGGSSIAALVDGATVSFVRVDLKAGKGATGAAGDSPFGTGKSGQPGPKGTGSCASGETPVPADSNVPVNDCGNGESSSGGKGGTGNIGDGGAGNSGNANPYNACGGGQGGLGGDGGGAGGGQGGHSLAIAYTGSAPTYAEISENKTTLTVGNKGSGGLAGDAGPNKGEDGIAAPMQLFP